MAVFSQEEIPEGCFQETIDSGKPFIVACLFVSVVSMIRPRR